MYSLNDSPEASVSFRTMFPLAAELEKRASAFETKDFRSERAWHLWQEMSMPEAKSKNKSKSLAWIFRNPSQLLIKHMCEFFWISKEDAQRELLRAADKLDPKL